jgi:hypothetical protein
MSVGRCCKHPFLWESTYFQQKFFYLYENRKKNYGTSSYKFINKSQKRILSLKNNFRTWIIGTLKLKLQLRTACVAANLNKLLVD